MRYKTTTKNKGNATYDQVATTGKKPSGRSFYSGKKAKAAAPSFMQLNENGPGVDFAGGSAVLEMEAPTQEAELASQLVAELENDSADVNILCETYDLKREELGRLTGFSLRALAEWASGKLPSQPAKRRLHEVRRLLEALSEIVKRESIKRWLHQPNPAFDRLTPLQVIEVGEMDRLWAMIHEMGSGQPA